MCGAKKEESSAFSQASEEEKKAASKAMNLLLQQDRTEQELRERLYRAGFSEKAAGFAMDYVMSFGYIDDLRYARTYLSCHKDSRSRKELRYKLINKGISPEILEEAFLQEYGESDEQAALFHMLQKRLRGARLSDMDYDTKNKVTAYLARKGYALPAIRSVMREWEQKESEESV
ncbi:MAG: regulatory protein RecX [Lachnospiraceae bacterium]|nr:regulatory protein RecX [Lachnospiraceae bacterium]